MGLERAGMKTVGFCEKDLFCQRILKKHWPDVPIHSDIRELDGRQYEGTVDVVSGGFPCQPFSVAGKQRGKDDDRALWPEMLRVIREVEPAWVIGENVPGIISMELDNVLSALEDQGYASQTFVLPACAVDAPHRRDRVWVVAYTDRNGKSDESFDERQDRGKLVENTSSRHDEWNTDEVTQRRDSTEEWQSHPDSVARSGEDVADSNSQRPQGRQTFGDSQGVRAGSDEQFKRCFDSSSSTVWEPEPGVGRVANGVSHRVDRLRGLGNAVVPQLIQAIGELVLTADKEMTR